MDTRQQDNRKIVQLIAQAVEEDSYLRFVQLLWALGIVDREDRFYEESRVTLEKVKRIAEIRSITKASIEESLEL